MRILAIETSCDETGIAIVEGEKEGTEIRFQVLSNILFSQASLHASFGGVYPTLAKREHEKNLPLLLEQALQEAHTIPETIRAIVVTQGPGLEPALWSGVTFAQTLAQEWHKPLFGVNHLEGHLISSLVEQGILSDIALPVLGLLISGGHSEFTVMSEWFTYAIIGETRDDAVGEAFDKVARMLDLPYPGGPHVSRLAKEARIQNLTAPKSLPRPMVHMETCDVSFSGLKTAMLYALRDHGTISEQERMGFAREFEDAVTDVFVAKTRRALALSHARTFVIGGGVAANLHIRTALERLLAEEFPTVILKLPELSITGDNAVMIAEAALVRFLRRMWDTEHPPVQIRAIGNLSITEAK